MPGHIPHKILKVRHSMWHCLQLLPRAQTPMQAASEDTVQPTCTHPGTNKASSTCISCPSKQTPANPHHTTAPRSVSRAQRTLPHSRHPEYNTQVLTLNARRTVQWSDTRLPHKRSGPRAAMLGCSSCVNTREAHSVNTHQHTQAALQAVSSHRTRAAQHGHACQYPTQT
jgi:hypothetical protein